MRKSLAALWLTAVCCGLTVTFAIPTPAFATSSKESGVVLSHITVTATKLRGNSAVSMTITNDSRGPITLMSVTSPDTQASMIDYDVNMCQGKHTMLMLMNIFITSGRTQKLGYKYQGAMLRLLKKPIVKGEIIPLVITWSNFQKAHSVTVKAKVVAPPRSLYFGMTTMDM